MKFRSLAISLLAALALGGCSKSPISTAFSDAHALYRKAAQMPSVAIRGIDMAFDAARRIPEGARAGVLR